jgi:hypothetical protein
MAGLVVFLFWRMNNTAAPEVQGENVALRKQLAAQQEELAQVRELLALQKEAEQVKRSDLERSETLVEEAGRAIDDLEEEARAWQQATAELLATDKGKPIAAREESLMQWRALVRADHPDPALAASLRDRFTPLKAFVDKAVAAKDEQYAPSQDLVGRVEAVKNEASQAATAFRDLNRRLAALVASSPPAPPETPTLEVALRALEERLAAEEVKAIAEAVEKERRAGIAKRAEEKARQERMLQEKQAEIDRLAAESKAKELDAEKQAAMAEAAEKERVAREKAAKLALERKFAAAEPEIRQILMPFISPGYTQPEGREFRRATTTKGPVSLGALRRNGMLEPTVEALNQLCVATTSNRTNDRPLGSFPDIQTNKNWEEGTQRAQQLLTEFGELMVEKGLLAP